MRTGTGRGTVVQVRPDSVTPGLASRPGGGTVRGSGLIWTIVGVLLIIALLIWIF